MNELEEDWKNFHLIEEGALGIEIGDEVLEELNYKGERRLVGKVCVERSISQEVIESTLGTFIFHNAFHKD